MRFVLGEAERYEDRLGALIGFFVQARLLRGEPLLGIEGPDGLLAAAMVSEPGGPPSPPGLADVRERTWATLGPGPRARYEGFGAACAPLLAVAPANHLHLNMIGVRAEAEGRGLGRRLLEQVHDLSARHPTSRGVSLTTEDPNNLSFYKRFGYEMLGEATVAPGLVTWAFCLEDRT
jgi:GNAT superfamily N-acetyltransferase